MNESLKELAVRYFEGPIAPEEECELFGFLAASPENAALMREWEREWKQRHVPSADVLRSHRPAVHVYDNTPQPVSSHPSFQCFQIHAFLHSLQYPVLSVRSEADILP